ncbi:uncharacterized protein LOC144653548 [Oculina patagonica]
MAKFGLSFSGGGIKSAAFCSGVLRRLLQKNVAIDYLSCVSGGGYTGTAYLDWKYRHGKKDDKKWHQEFFNHMREAGGFICNLEYRPCQAVLKFVALLSIMIFVSIIAPLIIWGSSAFPMAYIVDFLVGSVLRGGDIPCPEEVRSNPNITVEQCEQNRRTSEAIFHRFILFGTPVVVSFISYFIKGFVQKGKGVFDFIITGGIVIFGFVFMPWFINEFLRRLPLWMKIFLVLPLFFVWISFPAMRRQATLMTIMYGYSFVIQLRVYHITSFGVEYSDEAFDLLLGVSAIITFFVPLVASIQQRLVHVWLRWVLQKSFYYPKTTGRFGCSGISWRDLFIYCPSFGNKHKTQAISPKQALTLDDLDDFIPTYIGCSTINRWRRTTSPREAHYDVLSMTPHWIERLDRTPEDEEFHGHLMPEDIYLSDCLATSAAAIDYEMGARQGDEAPFRDLKVMLGLSSGASVVADRRHEEQRHFCIQILPLLLEFIRILPLAIFFIVYIETYNGDYLAVGILMYYGISLLLAAMAVVPTGDRKPGRLERIARWFTINLSFIHFVRKMMQMTNHGPRPPPVLSLSDGGHFENLGILPLLKLRLKKIIAVDGKRTILDQDYGQSLLNALDLASKKLGCSFSGMDGRYIVEDIRDNFVERSPGSQPSSYRFRVQYYDKNLHSDGKTKVGEGEILYIAARHPDKAVKTSTYVTWEEALRDIDVDLEAGLWGAGPELSAEEVERLTFCCCECCHGNTCRGLSEAMCGAFPQHNTYNQFFTPAMFSAYHREGYRASMEAKVTEFVGGETSPPATASTFV